MVKRIFDVVISSSLILLLSPLLIFIFLILFFTNRGKSFFVQKRPGRDENIFKLLKFKTMNEKKDYLGNLLSNEIRITKIGKFLRKSSLDELPQLLNIFKGDMSLVGPRPLKIEYLKYYTEEQNRRHKVRPGLTGWAQVNGRNTLSWKKQFEYDVWYVDNSGFFIDIKIILLTFSKIVSKKDVDKDGVNLKVPFHGNNLED
ncbi:MAG: sugar transferase [Arcobacter sp.]|nr:sugar transferase [Arcobacter sp.]